MLNSNPFVYQLPSMKVLVVDDSAEIREVLSLYFDHENIDYELIDNGTDGLEAIRKHDYDLILLDLAIPQFSGVDVVESLKKDGIFESKNIVIFTASSDPKTLEELRSSGAKEIFKKPCSLDDLKALVDRYKPM
jgi:DNA-binding response OmpR family regulator